MLVHRGGNEDAKTQASYASKVVAASGGSRSPVMKISFLTLLLLQPAREIQHDTQYKSAPAYRACNGPIDPRSDTTLTRASNTREALHIGVIYRISNVLLLLVGS